MYLSRLDLPQHVIKGSVGLLQARLSDALDMAAQLKQAHWNVKGRDFFQLHQLFDTLHNEVAEFADTLAERITALGHVADGRSGTTARTSSLNDYPPAIQSGESHLRVIGVGLGQFGKSVRADIGKATALGDADTADLLTQLSRASDKHLWLVEAHLFAE